MNGMSKDKSSMSQCETTPATPSRLCKSTFNTTAPMYGVSLTSGKPVTVVQIFPDLLQQVIYETCEQVIYIYILKFLNFNNWSKLVFDRKIFLFYSSTKFDLINCECVQTYLPYLFFVIPLGPVTLTGQDYVLVESGCTCRPKYAQPGTDPNPTSIIPNF